MTDTKQTPAARLKSIRWKPSATMADIAKAHALAQQLGAQPATYEWPTSGERVTKLYWGPAPW